MSERESIDTYIEIYVHFRLLDLGYEKDVGEIINALDTESHRQTVLLSATLSEGKFHNWMRHIYIYNNFY